MSNNKQKTPEEIIAESGNGFNCKVATAFRNAGWDVTLSPYYVDSATNMPREFDLLCQKQFTIKGASSREHPLLYQLFVECKYLKQPIVFWFDIRDRDRALLWLNSRTPFKSNNANHAKQHHMQAGGHVAKLFSDGTKEENREAFYRALAQCLGALTQSDWGTKQSNKRACISYPVIVHSDTADLYRVDVMNGSSPPTLLETNIVLELNYAYMDRRGRNQQEYFLIDVVRFSRLREFLATLDEEVEAARLFLGNLL